METSLQLDNKSKQLNLFFKKRFEHDSNTELKLKGLVNTVNANAQVEGRLLKYFRLGAEPRFSEDDIYRPDGRLRLGFGAKASTASDDVFLTLAAKKKIRIAKSTEIVRGRQLLNSYTQATVGAHYDYNVRTEKWGGEALAAVSHAAFRFSDDQDLRVTAGVRAPLTATGVGRAEPFVRLEENAWSVTFDQRGGWQMRYLL